MMTTFSATDAALEGFRITREHPRAVLAWTGLALAGSLVSAVVLASLGEDARAAMALLQSNDTPDVGTFVAAIQVLAPLLALSLVMQCVVAAAVYRIVVRPNDGALGYLRLGGDELRLVALTFVYFFIALGLVFAAGLAAALLAVVAGLVYKPLGVAVGVVAELGSFLFLVYVAVRLSLAPAVTFAERRIAPFESWRLTHGMFWRLFGAYLLAICCYGVVLLLGMIVFTAIASAITLAGGGSFADVGDLFQADPEGSIATLFTPARIAYAIFGALMSAIFYAVMVAPGAVAYRALHAREETPA